MPAALQIAAIALLAVPSGTGSGAVRVAATTACPSQGELTQAFAALAWAPAETEVSVAALDPEHLTVALTQGGALRFRRNLLRGHAPCAELATTIALLSEAWLTLQSTPARPSAAVAVEAPAPLPSSAVAPRAPERAANPTRLRVRLTGGVVATAPFGASVDLALELSVWRRLGLGLHAALLSDASSANDALLGAGFVDAQVIVHRQRLGGFASARLLRTPALTLSALLSCDDLHGTAASPGYPSALATSTDTPLLGAALLLEIPLSALTRTLPGLWSRLSLVGQAGLAVALAKASYLVEADGPQVVLATSPRLLVDVDLGLGMRLL